MKHNLSKDATLIEVLQHLSPNSSKTSIKSWLKEERVFIDGKVEKDGTALVRSGQEVFVGAKPKYLEENVKILFQDNHLIVIDKPSGLLSVASNFEKGDTAHAILKRHFRPKKVYVVHRLDQDTSGVMLFALTEEAHAGLKKAFEMHNILRRYVGLVEGHLEPSSGTWASYLFEDENYVVRTTKDPEKGVHAITHYSVISYGKRRALVNFTLETGKKNQIRVHTMEAGHPIVGDKKYRACTNPFKRLCLHAEILEFVHPITKKKMNFVSPKPETFVL